ncbi:MAG: PilZ domain-containing protein [Phycisphaerae bacterium]|jgi:c-di-GMP-binding flagellar brake protein YcgR
MSYRGVERRRHKRYAVPCPAKLSIGDGQTAGKTINISDGGILIRLPQRLVPAHGGLMDIHLRVPRSTANTYMLEEFTSVARVVRWEDVDDGAVAVVGLEFTRPLALALEV